METPRTFPRGLEMPPGYILDGASVIEPSGVMSGPYYSEGAARGHAWELYRRALRAPEPDHEPMRLFAPAPNVIPGQLGL